MANTAQQDIDAVTATVTKAKTVIDGATAYVQSVPGLINNAVAAAIANGATEAQLEPLTTLSDTLSTSADALTAAMVANTTPPTQAKA